MIKLFTSKRFIDNVKVIDDINSFFNDTVLEDILSGDYKIGDDEVKLFEDIGYHFDENNTLALKDSSNLLKVILSMKYSKDRDFDVIFDVWDVSTKDMKILLSYADSYNTSLLCIKLCSSFVYSNYDYLIDNTWFISGGNAVANYYLTHNLSGGLKHIKNTELQEFVVRNGVSLYFFKVENKNNIILFDTEYEKDEFMKSLCVGIKNGGVSCRLTVPIDISTEDVYREMVKRSIDTEKLTRVIDADSVNYNKYINDDFKGVTILVGSYVKFIYNSKIEKVCTEEEYNTIMKSSVHKLDDRYKEIRSKIFSGDTIISDGKHFYRYIYELKTDIPKEVNIVRAKRETLLIPNAQLMINYA